MKEKIVDVMREQYGVFAKANTKKLNITDKDNLFSAYRKLALYFYANHDLTQNDELEMVKDRVISHFNGNKSEFSFSRIKMDDVPSDICTNFYGYSKQTKTSVDTSWQHHLYKATDGNTKNVIVAVSLNGSFKNSRLSKCYYFTKKDAPKDYFMYINAPLSYGYSVLRRNLFKFFANDSRFKIFDKSYMLDELFDPTCTKGKFAKAYPELRSAIERYKVAHDVNLDECLEVEAEASEIDTIFGRFPKNSYEIGCIKGKFQALDTTDGLFNRRYNLKYYVDVTLPNEQKEGKHYYIGGHRFLKNLAKRERMYQLLREFLRQTKNIVLQYDHDETVKENLNRARFFEEKKNIKQETKREMKRFENMLTDKFSHVEIDNLARPDQLDDLKPELKDTVALIPKADTNIKAILRFRRLRNHHALGIFTNVNNSIVVDFRSDKNGKIEKAIGEKNIGFQSFIHEYGHFLDYNMTCNEATLSLSPEFDNILFATQGWLDAHKNLLALNGENYNYLSLSSEIFARAFEVYISGCGLDNSLIKDAEVLAPDTNNLRYKCFDKNTRRLINTYFDNLFPTLKRNIQNYVKQQKKADCQKEIKKINQKTKINIIDYSRVSQLSLF